MQRLKKDKCNTAQTATGQSLTGCWVRAGAEKQQGLARRKQKHQLPGLILVLNTSCSVLLLSQLRLVSILQCDAACRMLKSIMGWRGGS